MMHHFNAQGMPYYNKIIIYRTNEKNMGIFLSEIELKTKINKHFILLPAVR